MSINKFYINDITTKKRGYRANWEPNKPIKLGDVGILEKGIFTVMTTLEDEGIEMKIRANETEAEWKFTTENSVSVKFKLSGEVPVAGSTLTNLDAGISISFHSENAYVFESIGNKNSIITNIKDIENAFIAKAESDKRWKKYVLIVEVIESDSATIIMSSGSGNVIDLKAKADAKIANANLANVDLGLSIVSQKISTDNIVAKNGVTPLYKVMGLRHPLFGTSHFETKSVGSESLNTAEEDDHEDFKVQEFNPAEIS